VYYHCNTRRHWDARRDRRIIIPMRNAYHDMSKLCSESAGTDYQYIPKVTRHPNAAATSAYRIYAYAYTVPQSSNQPPGSSMTRAAHPLYLHVYVFYCKNKSFAAAVYLPNSILTWKHARFCEPCRTCCPCSLPASPHQPKATTA
jgi:hypothetical protein